MAKGSSSSGGGIGFFGLLAVAFIVLKLVGYIDWSWWWVTAPLWAPLTIVLVIFLIWIAFEAVISASKRR